MFFDRSRIASQQAHEYASADASYSPPGREERTGGAALEERRILRLKNFPGSALRNHDRLLVGPAGWRFVCVFFRFDIPWKKFILR